MPGPDAPWDAMWWTPRIHLVLFVHRVDGLEPGLYLSAAGRRRARQAEEPRRVPTSSGSGADRCRSFVWRAATAVRWRARLSCDQDIAADGFFSLGMLADFDASLEEFGPAFYRHLFWESGVVGQVLYLEAEAAGARATGIGCFFDDPVHDVLGCSGHAFQSLYHFTVGMPVEDAPSDDRARLRVGDKCGRCSTLD